MKKFLTLFSLNMQDALDSRARSVVWFLLAIINPLTLLIFWQGALKEQSSFLSGWNSSSITSYYLLLMLASTLLHVHIEEEVAEYDIKEGKLSTYLLKPFSYLGFKFLTELPYRLLQTSFAVLIFVAISIFFPRLLGLDLTFQNITLLIPVLMLAHVISFLFKMIVGLATFWLTDYHGLQELVFVILLVLAGFVMPLEFYPQLISKIAHLTPFPYMIYYPVVVMQGKLALSELIKLLISQSFWAIILFLAYQTVWAKGVKKFTAIGI